jgi:hypothetical protein
MSEYGGTLRLDHFVFVAMGASKLAAATILNLPGENAAKRS